MNYSNPSINLSDGITEYITTNEDESDSTQYLSVLSQDLSLQEMNVTLTTDKVVENNEETNQPFIFTVDGTNEIYGVQVAQDDDGNLRKYQIQYSENINGDLVPMLETIQFLPLDEEQVLSSEEICASTEVTQLNDNFVVKNEEFITNSQNDFNIHDVTEPHINRDQEEWNIPTTNTTSFHMKHEPTTLFDQCSILQNEEGKTITIEAQNTMQYASVDSESTEISGDVEMDHTESRIMSVQHLDIQHCLKYEAPEEAIEQKHFQQLYSEENHITDSNHLVVDNSMVKNSQQEDLYHILDNSISNSKSIYDQSMQTILKESIDHPKTNILKKSIQKSLLKDFANSDHKIVYVQTLPEKENLTLVDIESFTKPSSRSLLKCNQPPQVLKQTDTLYSDDNYSRQNLCSKATPRTKETKQIQAYLRTKEAKQARQFMNFINSTTIPQVPERKERLPRKQQIKPVNHPDENIVVKEMIVSSNGFVEPISAEEKKYLPVTEYVELLDSGDEANSLCNNKKKRKNNKNDKLIEIEISDTDESDAAELEPGKFRSLPKAKNGLKKKRGRPPKNQTSVDEKKHPYPNSPPKMSRLDSDVESVTSTLQVITMESEMKNESENEKNTGSLKEISENSCEVESSTKNREPQEGDLIITEHCMSKEKSSQTNLKSKVSQLSGESTCRKTFEYKYECEKCKSKFINKFVMSRHDCILKFGSTFSCDICQQKFANIVSLNTHKKSHIKEPILKSNLTKISQGKIFPKKEGVSSSSSTKPLISNSRTSILSSKNPKQVSLLVKNIKQTLPLPRSKQLVVPATTSVQLPRHSTLPEKKCNSVDASENVELGNSRKPIEEGIYKPPLIEVTPGKTPRSNIFKWEKKCDKCSKNFDNNTSWFDHQVLNHGFKTPDKTIGEKRQKKIVKDVTEHKGIRAGSTVAKSFSMLKNKVQKI